MDAPKFLDHHGCHFILNKPPISDDCPASLNKNQQP
nr:MAG TPA: hypothetical protein [Caudoviricetes sp.]